MELTQEIVRELLDYNPETGVLTWKERDIKWFVDAKERPAIWRLRNWNSNFANKEAFTAKELYGYRQGQIFSKRYKAHRIIWLWMTGEWPDTIDHINGNTEDNRWINLQNVDMRINSKNSKKRIDNISGFKGVGWCKREGKEKHIGYFDSAEEAYRAYCIEAEAAGYTYRHIYGDK